MFSSRFSFYFRICAASAAVFSLSAAALHSEPFFSGSQNIPRAHAVRHSTELALYSPTIFEPAAVPEQDEESSAPAVLSAARPMVQGDRAVIRHGVAYAPSNAPQAVKNAIWAVNTIRKTPYKWGGGHGSFLDSGYDCSGSISFALHHAGVLNSPIPSRELMDFGQRGKGRWLTIYARNGHTFAVIAGLRLDTTDFQRGGNVGPRWHYDSRETWGFTARHPGGM